MGERDFNHSQSIAIRFQTCAASIWKEDMEKLAENLITTITGILSTAKNFASLKQACNEHNQIRLQENISRFL